MENKAEMSRFLLAFASQIVLWGENSISSIDQHSFLLSYKYHLDMLYSSHNVLVCHLNTVYASNNFFCSYSGTGETGGRMKSKIFKRISSSSFFFSLLPFLLVPLFLLANKARVVKGSHFHDPFLPILCLLKA